MTLELAALEMVIPFAPLASGAKPDLSLPMKLPKMLFWFAVVINSMPWFVLPLIKLPSTLKPLERVKPVEARATMPNQWCCS